MNTTNKDIRSNPGLTGIRMTESQLMLLLKLVSEYDFNLPDMSKWTVKKASEAIDTILLYRNHNKVKKRKKPYKFNDVLNRFIIKYPEVYNSIIFKNK